MKQNIKKGRYLFYEGEVYDLGGGGDSGEAMAKAEEALAAAQEAQDTADGAATAAGNAQTAADSKAPINHASENNTYGVGDYLHYGHVKLADTPNASMQAGDGYAATPAAVQAAIDRGKWDLLWTNASPGSQFAAQSIAVDLSNYDTIKILVKSSATGIATTYYDIPNTVGAYVIPAIYSGIEGSGSVTLYNRRLTIINSGFNVGDAYGKALTSTSSPPVANTTCIPWMIYGGNLL